MPVTIKFDPTAINVQSEVIPDASAKNDGVMTKAQAKKLEELVPGGGPPPSDADPQPLGVADPGTDVDYSRGDHVHAHGNQGGGAEHALVVPAGAAGFMSGADKAKLDGITPGAGVASVTGTAPIVSSGGTTPAISITPATEAAAGSMSAADKTKLDGIPPGGTDFAHVAAALGGEADPNANYVFKSDGSGSGTMTKNTQVIPNYITVGTGGDVDYNSIKDAVDAAIAQGASSSNLFNIKVYPGFYAENPITVKGGIDIQGYFDGLQCSVTIFALDPNSDLITHVDGGTISGCLLMGVSDPQKALSRIEGMPDTVNVACLNDCILSGCSNGVIINGETYPAILQVAGSLRLFALQGLEIGTGILCQGQYAEMEIYDFQLSTDTSAVFTQNPIQTGLSLSDGAQCGINSMLSNVSWVDNTQVVVNVNNGAAAIIRNPFCVLSYTVFQIGAGGDNAEINVLGGYLVQNQLNFNILSSTGVIFATVVTDMKKSFVTPGGILSGIIQNLEALATDLAGTSAIEYASERQASLPDFVHSLQKSGVRTGGDVTDPSGLGNSGLAITARAGTGWVVRDAPLDVINIAWSDTALTLPANQSSVFIYVDSVTLQPTFSTTAPSTEDILLAIVVTGATAIRYIHNTKVLAEDIGTDLQDYLLSTQKLVLNRGLAATIGSTARRFNIDLGAYYRSLVLISYAGQSDVTFDSFYGINGANEIDGVTDIDITNYSNAGVLTAMTAGWYRADSVYLTSDGQVSVLYGTQQFAAQTDAANTQIQPPMSFISETAFSIATLVVQQGVGIVQVVDQRTVVAKAGAASITVHGQLSGLLADDHTQYLLASGGRAMGGNLNMGTNQINNVLDVNGVVVENHHIRHQPGGADALPTGVAVTVLVGVSPSAGTSANLSRADHQHGISSGAPSTINTTNAEGVSSSVARMDHIHAHGAQTDPTLHALAVASGAAGFLSGADKTKLDGLPTSAVPTSRTLTAGAGMTGGGDLSADRTFNVAPNADGSIVVNPHDVQVGVLATDGQHGNRGGGALHANVVAGGAAGFMSGADKTKLDGLTPGAAVSAVTGTAPIASSGGTTPAISITPATSIAPGSMSATDKAKLDGIAAGATNTPLTTNAPANVTKAAASAGVATDAARSDHKHDISTAAAVTLAVGGANTEGSASTLARSDHTHALPAFGTAAGTFCQGNDGRVGAVQSLTGNVSAAAAAAPSAGQVLTALGPTTAQWATPLPSVTTAESSTPDSTSSLTDVVMSGMTLTPAAGTYMVWLSGDITNNTNSAGAVTSIYVGGVQVAASARQYARGNQPDTSSFECLAKVTVNGSQAIDGRWHVTGGTASNNARQLFIMKVS